MYLDTLSAVFGNLEEGRRKVRAAQQRRPTDDGFETARRELDAAVTGLRRAGAHTGLESAQEDLKEAWEIAERGPMKLFLADIHLHRARLFFREAKYPWDQHPDESPRGPKDDLAAAEKLIHDCGYHRRDEELADAKRAILG